MENVHCYGERKRPHVPKSWILPDQGSNHFQSCLSPSGTPRIGLVLIYIGATSTDGVGQAHDVLHHLAEKTIYSYIGQIHE